MFTNIKKVTGLAVLLAISACSDDVDLPSYKITQDSLKSNIKRTVEVELPDRVDEETLKALAEKIHSLSDVSVERTFIGYQLKGDHKNQNYWATTHYNPHLDVNIIGATAEDYEKLISMQNPEGEVLGSWVVSWGYTYKMTVYRVNNKTYVRNTFADGSMADQEVELSQTGQGFKLQDEAGKGHGEYYIINNVGNIEFWGKSGNFYTATKS